MAIAWPRLSVALALRDAVPPEATSVGEVEALTDSAWPSDCTVKVVEAVPVIGVAPLQVAVTARATVRFAPVVLAAAV